MEPNGFFNKDVSPSNTSWAFRPSTSNTNGDIEWSLQIYKQRKIKSRISLHHHGNCRLIYPPYPILTQGLNIVSKEFYFREPVVSHSNFFGDAHSRCDKVWQTKGQRPGRSRLSPEKAWQEKFIASLMRHRMSFVSIILHPSKFFFWCSGYDYYVTPLQGCHLSVQIPATSYFNQINRFYWICITTVKSKNIRKYHLQFLRSYRQ